MSIRANWTRRIVTGAVGLIAVTICFFVIWALLQTWSKGASRSLTEFKDRIEITLQMLSFVVVVFTAAFGLFTVVAALAPAFLGLIGLGPDLILLWEPEENGYLYRWNRTLSPEDKQLTSLGYPVGSTWEQEPAIIIRMAIHNAGDMAAEAVQVVLEEIEILNGGTVESDVIAKFSRLRWSDGYDLDDFEKVKHHRCGPCIEPIIYPDSRHFIDFAFVFQKGSIFYKLSNSEGPWNVHPFYQWLPAQRENAVMKPGISYKLTIAVSAKNFGTVNYPVFVDCTLGDTMPDNLPQREGLAAIVGNEDGRPIVIRKGEPFTRKDRGASR